MEKQTFQEMQLGMLVTMQSLIHQIEQASREKGYKFKFKQETEMFYKLLEKVCEDFSKHFSPDKEFRDAFVQTVAQIDRIAAEIRITDNTKK